VSSEFSRLPLPPEKSIIALQREIIETADNMKRRYRMGVDGAERAWLDLETQVRRRSVGDVSRTMRDPCSGESIFAQSLISSKSTTVSFAPSGAPTTLEQAEAEKGISAIEIRSLARKWCTVQNKTDIICS